MKKMAVFGTSALLASLLALSACSGAQTNQQAPEPPEGGQPPSGAPEGAPGGGAGGGAPGGGAGSTGGSGEAGEINQGSAAITLDTDTSVSDREFTSRSDDENALRISDATVSLNNVIVNKQSGNCSNTEAGDFYGMNAALLATDAAQLTIGDSQVTSSAKNGNGIFSYGESTVVNANGTTISTTGDNSGGIQTAGGATTYANDLTVTTEGNSSAAIRSDRGGGIVRVNGGSFTTSGLGSPAIYSTADIAVSNAELNATNSEALVLEGNNSISLENCTVSGAMSASGPSGDENIHNVMIYQSMSGDAAEGIANFNMRGGTLAAAAGDMFYVTNTHAVVQLSEVALAPSTDGRLLAVVGNSGNRGWGAAGSNGATVDFIANKQQFTGAIEVDSISQLMLTLSGGSTFTGTINITSNEQASEAIDNNAIVSIDHDCTWTLTGDCTISQLDNHGTINFNGYTITLANGEVLS